MLQNEHAIIYFLACSCVYTICLYLELAFETVFETVFVNHFLFRIITHVGGSNGVNTGPMQHSLTTAIPIKCQKILFKRKSTGLKCTPTKRRVSTSHLLIWEPVSQLHNLLHSSPALPSLSFHASPFHPRASRGFAMHVFLVEMKNMNWCQGFRHHRLLTNDCVGESKA